MAGGQVSQYFGESESFLECSYMAISSEPPSEQLFEVGIAPQLYSLRNWGL